VLATIGSGVLALSIVVLLVNMVVSSSFGRAADSDPWGGHTLEWWTTSPPPRHNFATLPRIRTFAPLLDARSEARQPQPTTDPALT
jgi:cytochrome c oxidase subunit 1